MDPELERLLEELIAFGRAHDAELEDRRERLRNVEPETAGMLALLLRTTEARRVLEIGTSNGYSTLWLADAASDTDGKVTTIEFDAPRAEMARKNFARAGLMDRIELRCEDAAQSLRESSDDAWDFVFLDAERSQYVRYWNDLVRALRPLGMLAVDNVVSHADEVADFRALVERREGVVSALVPIGAGVLLVTKTANRRKPG
jgi:predicted O-methyltransferase YrrM